MPGTEYCAGGSEEWPFGRAEKWSQEDLFDYVNWTNYDFLPVGVWEDCVTVPGDPPGGGDNDDPGDPPHRECVWVSGPGYGYWVCVTG